MSSRFAFVIGLPAIVAVSLAAPAARADWPDYRVEQRCSKLAELLQRTEVDDWSPARIAEIETVCASSLPGQLLLVRRRLAQGEVEDARARLLLAERLPGADRLGVFHFYRGLLLARDGDYSGALLALHRAEAEGGGGGVDGWLLDQRTGEMAMAAGRLGEAQVAFRRGARSRADQRGVMFGLAVALDRAGDLEGANKAFSQALRGERRVDRLWPKGLALFPPQEEHLYRALLFAHVRRQKEACDELGRYLELSPLGSPWIAHAQDRQAALCTNR